MAARALIAVKVPGGRPADDYRRDIYYEVSDMDCKTMAVFLDAGAGADDLLGFALRLAKVHGASLTSFQLEQVAFSGQHDREGRVSAALQYEHDVRQQRLRQQAAFAATAAAQGVDHDWFLVRQPELEAAVALACEFDLLIVSQPDGHAAHGHGFDNLVDRLLLASGRPLLLVSSAAPTSVAFAHVVIAWNGGRESARALADALPLLQLATRITVIMAPPLHPSAQLPQPNPVAYLLAHEVSAEVSTLVSASDDKDSLLAQVTRLQEQADLLVAGAYGHSRVGEIVFGGVTRALLKHATIPLLMSH